ncbi:MAG: diacylglycerol kinase family lipid kinase [Chitinophagales bacterium]|nr:diacylglycerol kinase family lipid kinase [Bacteroidota bacterium]
MKIAFLLNGTIHKIEKIRKNIALEFQDIEHKIFISEYSGHLTELAKTHAVKDFDTIIIGGGDGTLNEGINGILAAFKNGLCDTEAAYDWEALKKIRVGMLPLGSGNDFAKTVDATQDIKQLKKKIIDNKTQLIDIGWVSFFNAEQNTATRFFINITDVGMGGEVVLKLQNRASILGTDINYFWAITSTLATYKKVKVKASGENFQWEGKIINFIVANGKYFGNGLGVAPEASISDGMFEIVIIGDITLLEYFKNLSTVKKCQKVNHPEVQYHRVNKINIESMEARKISIDMDGEFIGYAPMTLLNLKQKINFIC